MLVFMSLLFSNRGLFFQSHQNSFHMTNDEHVLFRDARFWIVGIILGSLLSFLIASYPGL